MLEPSRSGHWLIIDASQKGVLRFGIATASARPEFIGVRNINVESLPTFTDALQRFESESGISLRGTHCVMALTGVTSGETLSPVRSRWTITRAGLAAVFGQPITIINEVAARAWAVKAARTPATTLRGSGAPDLNRPGRYALINIDEGLGAALVDVDRELRVRILETEAGHTDFPPASEVEQRLAESIRGPAPTVSWEAMLVTEPSAPVWSTALLGITEPEKMRILSNMLGRFSVNLIHAYSAWNGVMLTGQRGTRILNGNKGAFEEAFCERRTFRRLVNVCPAWLLNPHEAVLVGAAQCLAAQLGHRS
jgi:glucokinase